MNTASSFVLMATVVAFAAPAAPAAHAAAAADPSKPYHVTGQGQVRVLGMGLQPLLVANGKPIEGSHEVTLVVMIEPDLKPEDFREDEFERATRQR